ncbi:MAG: gfo/Idh/MocA family oxidoreductase, partial [Clostridia bacterium]|nr:gfo/Idh/MocA family oxidoreductase [Clostridia bacterium]
YHVYVSFRSHRSIPGLGGDFTNKDVAGGGALIDWGVHFLDIVMYCTGDPVAKTVSAETFSKLGNPMEGYVYKDMWAGPPKLDGVYNVEEGIAGIVRTDGPTITINGAWAQNIGENEMFIDFMGTKGGVRLIYGGDFTLYTTKNGMLQKSEFRMQTEPMFQKEIDSFINCIESGEKLPSHIDTNIITSRMMDALYRSAETHKEINMEE